MAEKMTPVYLDWTRFDLPGIWAMIEPEREGANREQVSAWLRTSEMLASHQTNLQTIRDRLAERWPPTGSGAARQVLARIDAFILATRTASEVARTNASALSLLTDALANARSQIEPLYSVWRSAAPPQRMQLSQRVRTIMAQTDAIVAEHGGQFAAPDENWWISREGIGPGNGTASPTRTVLSSRPANIPPLSTNRGTVVVGPSMNESDGPTVGVIGDPTLSQAATSGVGDRDAAPSQEHRYVISESPAGRSTVVGGFLELEPSRLRLTPLSGDTRADGRGMAGTSSETQSDRVIRGSRSTVGSVERSSSSPEGSRITHAPWEGGVLGGGGGTPRRAVSAHRPRYPSDDAWETLEGVSPVLQAVPLREYKFDPGPNVIGYGK